MTVALVMALVSYHLYFSQLYCEAHVGAHVTVMIPPALLLLALSASRLEPASYNDEKGKYVLTSEGAQAGSFTAWLIKIVVCSSYCSAGLSKLYTTVTDRTWLDGSALQAFIFEATLMSDESTHSSFGVPTPFTAKIQNLLLNFPRLILAPM